MLDVRSWILDRTAAVYSSSIEHPASRIQSQLWLPFARRRGKLTGVGLAKTFLSDYRSLGRFSLPESRD
jgi:hypothetical protein